MLWLVWCGAGDLWGHFKDENFELLHERGVLSMANSGPNRNGSQFFVTLRPCKSLNGKHVVFGKVGQGATSAVVPVWCWLADILLV